MNLEQVVYLKWVDSCGDSSWNTRDNAHCEELDVITIGFIVNETDKCITISSSYFVLSDRFYASLTIPKCAIIERYNIDIS